MIIKGDKTIRSVMGISTDEEKAISNFLQGAVYCWCKNRKGEWFSLRDLMGGDNYYWNNTPLFRLWEKQNALGKENPVEEAGKECGWILKKVIAEDKRNFETKKEELIRKYKWIE